MHRAGRASVHLNDLHYEVGAGAQRGNREELLPFGRGGFQGGEARHQLQNEGRVLGCVFGFVRVSGPKRQAW